MTFAQSGSLLGKACGIWLLAAPWLHGETLSRPPLDTAQAQQVQIVLEGEGNLTPRDAAAGPPVPLKVHAELTYLERSLPADKGTLAARVYQQADATINAAGKAQSPTLGKQHTWIAFQRADSKSVLYSPDGGPLTQSERDLLEIPAPSPLLNHLLPEKPVSAGETWTMTDTELADLFNLEVISEQSVKGEFLRVDKGIAICQLTGKFSGTSDHVLSTQQVEAKFNVDLKTQQVTWLAMLVRETHAPSVVRPGFTMTARIRIRRDPAEMPAILTSDQVTKLGMLASQPVLLLRPSHGEFELVHNAQWVVTQDRRERTTLELIDPPNSLAQCSITPLPDLPIGKTVTTAEFRQDIEGALGANLSQIVDGRESTDEKLSSVRVLATGSAQGVPVQWIYYHVTNPQGRRAVLVFTLKQEDASRIGAADLELVQGITFATDLPSATEPAAATAELPTDGAEATR